MSGSKTMEVEMIDALLKRKRAYERYFNAKAKQDRKAVPNQEPEEKSRAEQEHPVELDHKAEQAYAGLIKMICDLNVKLGGRTDIDPEETRRIAREILTNDYGVE